MGTYNSRKNAAMSRVISCSIIYKQIVFEDAYAALASLRTKRKLGKQTDEEYRSEGELASALKTLGKYELFLEYLNNGPTDDSLSFP